MHVPLLKVALMCWRAVPKTLLHQCIFSYCVAALKLSKVCYATFISVLCSSRSVDASVEFEGNEGEMDENRGKTLPPSIQRECGKLPLPIME